MRSTLRGALLGRSFLDSKILDGSRARRSCAPLIHQLKSYSDASFQRPFKPTLQLLPALGDELFATEVDRPF